MKSHLISIVLVAFVAVSCGQHKRRAPEESDHPATGEALTLRLFGAPWCENCEKAFPQINESLKAELTKANPNLTGEVYVPTGTQPSDKPSPEVTEEYRKSHVPDFKAYSDEWPWKKFREQVQQDRKLPGAVVLDKSGKVIKVFLPGSTTFNVEQIVAFVKGKVK